MRQGVMWSKSKDKLTESDRVYQINQILMYGDIEEIKKMIKMEGLAKIKSVFEKQPIKVYTKEAFQFVKNYILGITKNLNPGRYVKTLY